MDKSITVARVAHVQVTIKGHDFTLTIPEAVDLRDTLSSVIRAREETLMDTIKGIVARHFKIRVERIDSEVRDDETCRARHAFFVLAREAGYNYAAIGRSCGNRDHGTVMHGCSVFQDRVEASHELKRAITFLRQRTAAARNACDGSAFTTTYTSNRPKVL